MLVLRPGDVDVEFTTTDRGGVHVDADRSSDPGRDVEGTGEGIDLLASQPDYWAIDHDRGRDRNGQPRSAEVGRGAVHDGWVGCVGG